MPLLALLFVLPVQAQDIPSWFRQGDWEGKLRDGQNNSFTIEVTRNSFAIFSTFPELNCHGQWKVEESSSRIVMFKQTGRSGLKRCGEPLWFLLKKDEDLQGWADVKVNKDRNGGETMVLQGYIKWVSN